MSKGRLEAFSDGVIAIILTIMVLELRPPHESEISALAGLMPHFLAYLLSFAFVGMARRPMPPRLSRKSQPWAESGREPGRPARTGGARRPRWALPYPRL